MTEHPTPADLDPDVDDDRLIDDGPIVGELVPAPAPDDVDVPAVHRAIEAAANAALTEPNLPGRDEFLAMAMMARIIAGSDLAPKAIRQKPADAFVLLLTARDLQIPLTSAMRKVYVIDGQPSIAPQLECALIRRAGLGAVIPYEGNATASDWQAAVAVGPDGQPLGPPVYFTWDDARTAQLVANDCQPGDHTDECKANQSNKDVRVGPKKCKSNWITYPRDDMWWRAAGRCARWYFPEAALGLYSPDELGAITDEQGVPIDPSTVALPEGFEAAERRTGGTQADQQARREREAEAARPADADTLTELVVRAKALPDAQRAVLNEKWRENPRLSPHRVDQLPASEVTFVKSMLTGLERLAERDPEWDGDAARAAVRESLVGVPPQPAEGAQEAPEPSDAPDDAEPASDAADGGTGADPGEPADG